MKEIFQSISAKAGPAKEPCCDWVGDQGAGHYVKMVHNGIEYGDMELICEAYSLMKQALGMECAEMSKVIMYKLHFHFHFHLHFHFHIHFYFHFHFTLIYFTSLQFTSLHFY